LEGGFREGTERYGVLNVQDRIVGELMQPGGLQCLERMGLVEAATSAASNSVGVEGYVCIPPAGDSMPEVVLPYPGSARGVSFHNHLFVAELRRLALEQPSVRLVHGRAAELVLETGSDGSKRVCGVMVRAPTERSDSGPAPSYAAAATASGRVERVDEGGSATVRAALTVVCDGSSSIFRGRVQSALETHGAVPPARLVSYFAGILVRHELH
jgi:squalene monooxygenase